MYKYTIATHMSHQWTGCHVLVGIARMAGLYVHCIAVRKSHWFFLDSTLKIQYQIHCSLWLLSPSTQCVYFACLQSIHDYRHVSIVYITTADSAWGHVMLHYIFKAGTASCLNFLPNKSRLIEKTWQRIPNWIRGCSHMGRFPQDGNLPSFLSSFFKK